MKENQIHNIKKNIHKFHYGILRMAVRSRLFVRIYFQTTILYFRQIHRKFSHVFLQLCIWSLATSCSDPLWKKKYAFKFHWVKQYWWANYGHSSFHRINSHGKWSKHKIYFTKTLKMSFLKILFLFCILASISESAYAEARPAALFQIFDDASSNLIYQNKLNIPIQIHYKAQIVPITLHTLFYYVPVQIETTNVWRCLWLSLKKKMIYRFIYAAFHENFNDMIDKRWFTRWEKKNKQTSENVRFCAVDLWQTTEIH